MANKKNKISLSKFLNKNGIKLFDDRIKQLNIDGVDTDYIICDNGDIISYRSDTKRPIKLKPIIIERQNNKKGMPCYNPKLLYRGVNLNIDNNKEKLYYVHRLVAMSFIPNPDNKPEVNHKNGDKGDNRVENLEWVTPSENIQHAYKNGLAHGRKGSLHHNSKIDEEIAFEACVLILYSKLSIQQIADKLNTTYNIISKINKGQRWKHVSKNFNKKYSLMKNRKNNLECSTTREKQIIDKYCN